MSQQALHEVTQDTDVDEALVEEIVEAFNRGNADEIVEYFHDDGVFQVARGPAPTGVRVEGREAIRKFLKDRSAKTPDWYWHPIRNWVAGDKAVAEWKVEGTDASGEKFEWFGCDLLYFEGRKMTMKDTFWKGPNV
ncbi:MAG: hypothetical protein CL731_04635 [Chloroflexi bacterium]|nr:hypothetical protein [Chloroflexota bacterium]|tara:strand:+ start:2675 stop:3082 length:408 start_codon:yes stop_codon:yes gene_type:complete